MGQCLQSSGSPEAREGDAGVTKQIDKELKEQHEVKANKIKLLLLGAGESGKSTLFKQMKLIYTEKKDFEQKERETFTGHIYSNVIGDIQTLLQAAKKKKVLKAREEMVEEILSLGPSASINDHVAELLKESWDNDSVQALWHERGDLHVQDSLVYFMDNIDRVAKKGFVPSNDDILRTRVRTTGVVKDTFKIFNSDLEMYDVGGQRNERRKWINAFDDVTVVIFVAAISEYNQVLYEDADVNRQDEAVMLFRDTLKLECFLNTPFILFLNKDDLFREKLPVFPFRLDEGKQKRNLDFTGPHLDVNKTYSTDGSDNEFEAGYTAACNYIQALYERQSPPNRTEKIYPKFTTSTDTKNINHIMESCRDVVMRGNLSKIGWL